MQHSVCYQCPDRSPTCHAGCKRYAKEYEWNRQANAKQMTAKAGQYSSWAALAINKKRYLADKAKQKQRLSRQG